MFEKSYDNVNLNVELSNAVLDLNIDKVKELLSLDNPPYVNFEVSGVPLIMYAAQQKNWELVETLYNFDANLDCKIEYLSWYLIHECVKSAPAKVTKAIFEYCNINSQTKNGKTALMIAVEEKKYEIANFFVDSKRMDLSLLDKKANNVAHYAAINGDYDLFIKLIQNGAPINQENDQFETPIDLIRDISFKENLPKILGELSKIEKIKLVVEDKGLDVKNVEPIKKVSGLSSIKRK